MNVDLCYGVAENRAVAPLDKAAGNFYFVSADFTHFPCAHDFGEGEADKNGYCTDYQASSGWYTLKRSIYQ